MILFSILFPLVGLLVLVLVLQVWGILTNAQARASFLAPYRGMLGTTKGERNQSALFLIVTGLALLVATLVPVLK